MYWIIGILILFAIIVDCITRVNNKTDEKGENNIESSEKYDITAYYRGNLLTKREYAFFMKLKPIAKKYHLHILTKIRMEDIAAVKKELPYKERNIARNRVKSRHFDFVLVDPETFYIKLIIELDDYTHDTEKSQKTDKFKDEVLKEIDIPFIRIRNFEETEEKICSALKI